MGSSMFFRAPWVRLYSVLAKVRPIYRYGASALFLLLFIAIWRTTILATLESKRVHYKAEVENLKNHVLLLEGIKSNNTFLNNAIENLKKSLTALPASYQQSLGSNIDFVFNQAAQSGVAIGMCLPQDESDQGWCYEHKIFFDFDGTFNGIKNFFDEIAKQKRMIRCTRLYITKNDDDQLKVACILNFYTAKPEMEGL